MESANSKKNQDLTLFFQEAIRNLERFSLQNEASQVPHIFHLDVKNQTIIAKSKSFFRKIWVFFRYYFFSSSRKKKKDRFERIQEELLRSVMTVKKHYPLLDRFKTGSEEQKQLAVKAQEVIHRYDTIIHQARQIPTSSRKRIVKFFYDSIGVTLNDPLKSNLIDLPFIASAESDSQGVLSSRISNSSKMAFPSTVQKRVNAAFPHVVLSSKEKDPVSLSQQEMDAFCMKAITLIKNHAVSPTSIREALELIKAQPIVTSVHSDSDKEDLSKTAIVSLSQTLSVFPGEVIELYGAFKRDSQSTVWSVPISEKFQLSSKSIQHGFPHPLQYHGWTLSHQLIPSCPLRVDYLPLFSELLRKKKQLALDLLPQGAKIDRAKKLLKLKKQAFYEKSAYFLTLQKKLHQAVFHAAKRQCIWTEKEITEISLVMDRYFEWLKSHPAAFDCLAKHMQEVNTLWIERPLGHLGEVWMEGSNEGLRSQEAKIRSANALKILNEETDKIGKQLEGRAKLVKEEKEKISLEYLAVMGKILVPAIFTMIVQQNSEKIEYAPPMLREYDYLMQTWLYQQEFAFLRELEEPFCASLIEGTVTMHDYLTELFERDIALFSSEDVPSEGVHNEAPSIVHELEDYFNRVKSELN